MLLKEFFAFNMGLFPKLFTVSLDFISLVKDPALLTFLLCVFVD